MTSARIEIVPDLLEQAAASGPDRPALGIVRDGKVSWRTWSELQTAVRRAAGVLTRQGVDPEDRVAQWSGNCEGWIVADLAIQSLGAVHVPIHAALTPKQAAEQISDAEAKLLVVDDKSRGVAGQLVPGGNLACVSHEQLAAVDQPLDASPARRPSPDDLATILYTSGTTGQPLGVMLSHRNLIANVQAMAAMIQSTAEETRLGVLPLSHVYARTCDLYVWLLRGSRLALAESRESVLDDCRVVQPTALNAVPYFYQRLARRLSERQPGADGGELLQTLGGKVRRCYCGGAALDADTERFFAQRGLPVMCGYGLSEASPVVSMSSPDDFAAGYVGRPLENLEIRLDADGELSVRGPSVMVGYWRNEPATRERIVDGWLRTGDLAEQSADGRLRILGRKKEILVLATGKNVAPTRIEGLLAASPWIEQACVVGDGRKCLTALVVPRAEILRAEIRRRRLWVWSKRRAVNHPAVRALYRQEIDRCLAEAAAFEQIADFRLLDRGFSLERGELTTKFSLRRAVIDKNFSREISDMYRALSRRSTGSA
jgi:long-chain acyl-CoA synthetase